MRTIATFDCERHARIFKEILRDLLTSAKPEVKYDGPGAYDVRLFIDHPQINKARELAQAFTSGLQAGELV